MAYRPSDWSPLAGSDPVPGDPDEVTAMARHYRDTADEISDQVARLDRIASVQGWEGEAARVFTEAAGDLVDELGKAHRRHAEVAGAVAGWAEPLRTAQSESLAALREAQAAEQAAAASAGSLLTGVEEPTPEQKDAQDRREAAHDAAAGRLEAAKRKLEAAVSALDDAADRAADAIRDAANHHADSRWDRFKGWVQDHAGVLKVIADVAALVATAAAVVALVITSPVWAPVVAALAIGAAAIALVGHSMLASAGEGSWADVAIDLFSIATLGVGRLALAGVKGGTAAARAVAASNAGRRAFAAVLAQHRGSLTIAGWALRTRLPLGPLRRVAGRHVDDITRLAGTARDRAAQEVLERALPQVTLGQTFRAGERELARHLAELRRLAPELSTEAIEQQLRVLRTGTWAWRAGTGVDLLDKVDQASSYFGGPSVKPDVRYELTPEQARRLVAPIVLPVAPYVLHVGRP